MTRRRSYPRAKDYDGPRTAVIDISHWQGDVDFEAVAGDPLDIAAVIVRLGDGKDDDRRAAAFLKAAKAAGKLVGAYRYLRADHPLSLHVESDKRVLEAAGVELDLPLCPDLEGAPDLDGRGPRKAKGAWQNVSPSPDPDTTEVLERVHEYLEHAYAVTGLQPWLYTGRAWLDFVKEPPPWAAQTPLWLAIGAGGRVPEPWGHADVVLHQHSARGRVRGITGNVDLNHFHGTAAELRAIRGGDVAVGDGDGVDRVAALYHLAEGAAEAEREVLLRAARELGELRAC